VIKKEATRYEDIESQEIAAQVTRRQLVFKPKESTSNLGIKWRTLDLGSKARDDWTPHARGPVWARHSIKNKAENRVCGAE
jgi:hypothetical protein